MDDKIDEVKALAAYVRGVADSTHSTSLANAAEWLEKLSHNICGQGIIGCHGRGCTIDHK